MGRSGAAASDFPRKCRRVPDMGAGQKGQACKEAGRHDVQKVHRPASRSRLRGRVARVGGGRLWRTDQPQAICSDCPLRRKAHCVARADPRSAGQRSREERQAETVAQRGGDHRLEPALPVHLRHQGGNQGAVQFEGGAAFGGQHHAAHHPRRG